ncbi:sugar phosphate isomerase/epimerase [Streptomyces sp. SLBN-31]|jgi:sugar phosphate isomerase/epimerase|uniref:sugar phosphate isomerase/epimerase family protein n=1 Tax=Streptomyces sp. SLBN-31 TaxID=2768444 RepID=UPI001154AEA9|nr:sugar phosphate isomerase/epimerase [Streptomyces sp. SLBN-31]TQJ91108.1 sugar phosphate isomerase/epimerase [Streptomyces sp. SLBN-31]
MNRTSQPDPELIHRLTRRGMLGVAAGATATALLGAATTPASAAADATAATDSAPAGRGRPVLPPGRLGIQLYSLRDKVSTLGFAPVFAELEKYGYDEVEFAGYTQGSAGPITLARLRRLARDHGLTPIGSHVGYYSDDPNAYTFAQNLTKVLDDAQALGLKHIGTASGPFRYGSTVDAWKRAAEEFNTYGAAARARGMKFYQHNHSDEFSFATDDPKVRLYDVLLAETDPDLVFLEMDIFWAYAGQFRFSKRPDGGSAPFEPLDYVLRQPHRYPLFHVKDGVSDPSNQFGYRMVDVGDGDIDYQRFISAVTRLRGERMAHHWQTEHDQPAESFTFARRSSAYLHSLREKC